MKYILIFFICCFYSCQVKEKLPSAKEILDKSVQIHDPNKQWYSSSFNVYIQEPRIGNPKRYSEVKLDNKNDAFELKRNREQHISTHIVSKEKAITYLDDKIETDTTLIKKYRLEPKRNKRYQRFYKVLLGLPMSLEREIAELGLVEEVFFNKENSYKVAVKLKEPLFSENWNLFFSKKNYKLIGIEMIFPDDPTKGERLTFDGEYIVNSSIIIPRIRHWKELNDTYMGSDILIENVEKK